MRLAKTRRDSPDLSERKNADRDYKAHLQGVFAMRRVDTRLSRMSAASCEPGCKLPNRCLYIRINGLDQAKGRCPRNLENGKQWSTLWRPQLHIAGVMVEGLFEQYWCDGPGCEKKDSSMECTVLSLALARARDVLSEKGLRLPEFLSIKYDNTTREGKTKSSQSGCPGSSIMVLLGKSKMDVASLGTPMTLLTRGVRSLRPTS